VLIAGGKGKGLDPSPLAADSGRLRGVVAIGESAAAIVALFDAVSVPVVTAPSMQGAVSAARSMARTGDVVLLSPGGASQDWYSDYAARGDDFAALVHSFGSEEVSS
jgi:UDP-N-acetylmuramoylalanine--D-glutamate ligase